MTKRKVSKKKKELLKKYHCISTPFDYSGDGSKEEEQARDNERNHEVIGRDGRMK